MLFKCPTCNGTGSKEVRRQSKRKGDGEEVETVDCSTCDGAGTLDRPPAT